MSVSQAHMTIVAMVQSFYILFSFANDSASKAASAIVSNLLAASEKASLSRVLSCSFTLQVFYFLLLKGLSLLDPRLLGRFFVSDPENGLLADPLMREMLLRSVFYMTLFFLFDGFSSILIGFLTAAGDTRFIFWLSLIVHWGAYVLPTVFLIGVEKHGADVAWSIIAGMSVLNALIYLYRYKSNGWMKRYQRL